MPDILESTPATSRGQFFAVDPTIFDGALSLGFNAAIMLLVMASGTGRNQRFTKWAVHATEKYTGMGRKRAGDALQALLSASLVGFAVPGKRARGLCPSTAILEGYRCLV